MVGRVWKSGLPGRGVRESDQGGASRRNKLVGNREGGRGKFGREVERREGDLAEIQDLDG